MPANPGKDSRDPTWFRVAAEADAILADPSRHGHASAAEALAALAGGSGMTPTTLRQNIAARRFLLTNYEDRVTEQSPAIGCTQILLLARLHEAASDEADRIVDDVLAGQITRRQLDALLKRHRAQREDGVALGARTEGKAAAMAFEEAALGFVETALDRFVREPGRLVRTWRWRGLVADAAIYTESDLRRCGEEPPRASALIEVKAARRETFRGRAREIVAQNLFLQRTVSETITALPWNDALVDGLRTLIDEHDICGQHLIRVATRPGSPATFIHGEIMTRLDGKWKVELIKSE